mmetsp:Transcript_126326/g.229351  ORF Transcript_126326/g.229351 Transcript_126326/m.229351 type:complete len:1459 (-) Transcript_126326:350-4726(-)
MEVNVLRHGGVPEGSVLSIRAGTVRRQAPVSSGRTFKFPGKLENPLKVDVFSQIASGYIVVRPGAENYKVSFADNPSITCELEVKDSSSSSAAPSPQPPEIEEPAVKRQEAAAASAKDYLEQHAILEFFQAVLQTVIKEKPDDPYAAMARHFLCGYNSAGEAAAPADVEPAPPTGQPAALPIDGAPASGAAQERAKLEAERKEFEAERAKLEEERKKLEELSKQLAEERAKIDKEKEAGKNAEKQRLEEVKSTLRETLERSSESGELAKALATAKKPDAAADSDGLRSKLRVLLEESGASGELEKALNKVLAKKAPEAEDMRAKLRDTLERSYESGDLRTALEKVKASKEASADSNAELMQQLRSTLERSVESGELRTALEKVKASKAAKAAAAPQESTEDMRAKLRDTLEKSSESGALKEALAKVKASKAAPEDDSEAMRAKLRNTLEKSCESGELEKALATVKASKAVDPGEDLRAKLRDTLEKSCESGDLKKALATVKASKAAAQEDSPEAMREKLRSTLEKSCESGELEKALATVKASKAAPPQDEAEAMRANLRSALERSVDSGELEKALQKVRAGKTGQSVDDMKAKLRETLEQSASSGELAKALQVMKAPPATDKESADELRQKLRETLQQSCDSGQLKAALEAVKGGAPPKPEAAEDLRAQLKDTLQASCASGALEKALKSVNGAKEPMPTTELTEEVAAGSTVVPVAAAVGFTAGDPICIVSAAGSETNAIKGFGSIVLLFPLQFAHPPGTSISKLPLEDPRVKALPAEFFAFAEEVAKRAETPGKEAAPVAEDSKEQKEEAQPEEPKEELKPEPPAEEAKPELPKKEEAEPEEPQVELKSAPPQPATLETDDDAGALDMVQRLVYEPPDDTSEWEKQSFSDLASVATWISPRLRGGEPGIEEEPKPEEAQEEPFSFTFEEPEAPKAEPKPEPSAEEPQADEPTAVTEFRDMPSVATWMSPRLQPKMQEEAGGATVADAIDMEALPPPAEQEASSIQLKVSESGITVEAHISSAEVVPEVQEAAFAREPHKNLPSVSSWMMPLPRIRHRSVVPEEPKEEPKPELPKEEPKPEPLKEEARPEAVLPFSNYYSAHFAGASIIENIATSSFDAARAPKEEAKPEPQEEEPKLEEPEEETGRPAGFACLPSVGSWICSYHQAAKLQKLLTESDASRPTTAEPEPQTEEATPEAAQLQKLLEDSAASRPTTAEPEPEVAETAQDSRRPSQVEAVAQIAAEVIRVTSQPAAQAKVVQRAPPKLSAATAVSFKFENLDYDTVIASRKLTEMVEGQTVEALSYILQVPLNAIDVQLSEGSVTVDAHIFCLNPDAAVRMKNLIDEKSDVVLRAVDQCVIQIPKIADAIIDGKVGLGVAGLKASVTSVLRDETRQQELLSRLTSIRSGPPSRGSTIKSRETSRPSSRPSSGSTLHSSDVDAIVFDAFASLARRAFRPLR